MKTDFEKFRKWRHYQVAWAIVLITLAIVNIFLWGTGSSFAPSIAGLYLAFAGLKTHSYSCCPHCGKSFMSKWTGRDAAGRNCTKRIERHQSILCVHCGQEIDTN